MSFRSLKVLNAVFQTIPHKVSSGPPQTISTAPRRLRDLDGLISVAEGPVYHSLDRVTGARSVSFIDNLFTMVALNGISCAGALKAYKSILRGNYKPRYCH